MWKRVEKAYSSLKMRVDFKPEIGLVLGSGLGAVAEQIESVYSVPFENIQGMPTSTVQGHSGRFVFGYINRVPVVVMQGRVHYYEGYTPQEAVLPIRLMIRMGVKALILTNASGGIREDLDTGDLMMITDHISLVPSPLIGKNDSSYGDRFPDMSEAYDPALRETARAAAKKVGLDLKEGVYIQFPGPNFETPAEVRMARAMGADAVGMSTAIETIAAVHMGIKVLGLSFISNKACGLGNGKLSHLDVQKESRAVIGKMSELIREIVVLASNK